MSNIQDEREMKQWLNAVHITHGLLTECSKQEIDFDTGLGLHQRKPHNNDSDYADFEQSDSDPEDLRPEPRWSSGESDDDNDYGFEEKTRNFKYQEYLRYGKRKYKQHVDSKEEKLVKETPPWFSDQPFQHSGKLVLVSIPGLLLTLSLGSDMFIGIATIGALSVYLFRNAGYHERALNAYIVTFICLEMTVVYSFIPLLWKSWINLILVMSMFIYGALTGAWVLLLFTEFPKKDPQMAVLIELLLCTLYPTVCLVIMTFLLVSVTSPLLGPYCLLVLAYPVLTSFSQPTTSSFKKVVAGKPEESLVLQPAQTAACVLLYTALPPLLFTFCLIATPHTVQVASMIELLFLTFLSIILASSFDVDQFIQEYGISVKRKRYLTVACGGVVMAALPVVLAQHGVHSPVLPWLPLGVLLHTAFLYLLNTRKSQFFIYTTAAAIVAFYFIVLSLLPWNSVNMYTSQTWLLYISFILDVLLIISAVFAYNSMSQQAFGLLLLLQTLVLVCTLKQLEWVELTNVLLSALVAISAVYIVLRLYSNKKLAAAHACGVVALHISTALSYLPSSSAGAGGAAGGLQWWGALDFLLLLLLQVSMCRVMIFLQDSLTPLTKADFVWVLLEVMCLAALNAPFWLSRLLSCVLRTEPSIVEYSTTILLLGAITSAKLYFSTPILWPAAKYIAPSFFLAAILISVVEPQFTTDWDNMLKWMFLLSLLMCTLISRQTDKLKKSFSRLLLVSISAGFPLGFSLSGMVFPQAFLSVHLVNSSLTTSAFVIAILVWLESVQMEERILKSLFLTISIVLVGFITQLRDAQSWGVVALDGVHFLLISLFLCTLILAVVFKLQSLRRQSLQFSKEGAIVISKLPLLGNMCTLVAMITFCFVASWQRDLCAYLSSAILILLQRDHYVFQHHSKDNNLTPPIVNFFLFLSLTTVEHSALWSTRFWWPWLIGLLEVAVVIFTLPVLYILSTVLWYELVFISDRTVVFLTPLYSLLIVAGSSYASWCLAALGLAAGYWMTAYKLPLDR